MRSSTISRVRMHDLLRLGRFRVGVARFTVHPDSCASRRGHGTDTSGIGAASAERPRATSSRPGSDDLMELLI